jgi:predicted nucleic acid-binding protein
MENHGDLSTDRATLALRRVRSLRVHRVSTRGLLPVAWDLRRSLTIGDGLYVALARRLDVALVTADDRLSRAPALGVRIIT